LLKEIETRVKKVIIRDSTLIEALKPHLPAITKIVPQIKLRKTRPQDHLLSLADLTNPFEEEIEAPRKFQWSYRVNEKDKNFDKRAVHGDQGDTVDYVES
jgi:hypothetical protein